MMADRDTRNMQQYRRETKHTKSLWLCSSNSKRKYLIN